MSDELTISGGGVSLVGTATMFSTAELLQHGSVELHDCLVQLLRIEHQVEGGQLPGSSALGEGIVPGQTAIAEAAILLRRCAIRSGQLAEALRTAAERYSDTELRATRFSQGISATLGYGLGFLASWAVPQLLSGMLTATGISLLASALAGERFLVARERLADWVKSSRGILSNPVTVDMIRMLVMSSDDFLVGATHTDPVSAVLIGDEGLSIIGMEGVTRFAALAGAAAGFFADTPVKVHAGRQVPGEGATGAEDRAKNIPGSDPKDAQIRIDRISRYGEPDRFEVYLGGTIDFSAQATDEPFDLTSDLASVAGVDSAAYRATREAMSLAGITASSEVIFNGYSLGALVAARLAASGDYATQGLFTLGGPTGRITVPEEVPWLAVQHSDDLVPALAGTWSDPGAVVVERQVFADRPLDTSLAVPAHQLAHYQDTARLIDGIGEERVAGVLDRFAEFDRGADRVVSTFYRADRVRSDG